MASIFHSRNIEIQHSHKYISRIEIYWVVRIYVHSSVWHGPKDGPIRGCPPPSLSLIFFERENLWTSHIIIKRNIIYLKYGYIISDKIKAMKVIYKMSKMSADMLIFWRYRMRRPTPQLFWEEYYYVPVWHFFFVIRFFCWCCCWVDDDDCARFFLCFNSIWFEAVGFSVFYAEN